jgi:hypothetical protein
MQNDTDAYGIMISKMAVSALSLFTASVLPRMLCFYNSQLVNQQALTNSLGAVALVAVSHSVHDAVYYYMQLHNQQDERLSDEMFELIYRTASTPLITPLFIANSDLLSAKSLTKVPEAMIKSLSMMAISISDLVLTRSLVYLLEADTQNAINNLQQLSPINLIQDILGYAIMFLSGNDPIGTLTFGAAGQICNKIIGHGITHNGALNGLTFNDLGVEAVKGSIYNYAYFSGYSSAPENPTFIHKSIIGTIIEGLYSPFAYKIDKLYGSYRNTEYLSDDNSKSVDDNYDGIKNNVTINYTQADYCEFGDEERYLIQEVTLYKDEL